MGHHIKATYKQAEACYSVATAGGTCIATLQHYTGPQQNKPPGRFIVLSTQPLSGTFTRDISSALPNGEQPVAAADPLFPEKSFRPIRLDYLV